MVFERNAEGNFENDQVFKPQDFRHTAATLLVERGFMDISQSRSDTRSRASACPGRGRQAREHQL